MYILSQRSDDCGHELDDDRQMSADPYRAPAQEGMAAGSCTETDRLIKGPSAGLIVMLAFQLLVYVVVGLLVMLFQSTEMSSAIAPWKLTLAAAHGVIMLFMLHSMIQIRRRRQLRSGRIAAAIACVPFLTPWIWAGIPFGVWLSIILSRTATATEFQNGVHGSERVLR